MLGGENMLEATLELLKNINSHGFKSYIVGGFVRDYVLGIKSNDIDVATNATPKELKEIFPECTVPNEDYGSVIVYVNGIKVEITTFRKEVEYIDNRKPSKIIYVDNLEEDLLRRDFTINALCMNEFGEVIDYLNGKDDLEKKIIRCVGNPWEKFSEDVLRILRAIRFATILEFDLDQEIVEAIRDCKHLLVNLSYSRRKEELDKIFSSKNAKRGINLLLDLGLDKDLEIDRLNKIKNTSSLIGIWSVLDVCDKYPFSSNEKELIKNVNRVIKLNNLDLATLYKYGLYVNSVAGEIKGIDIKDITKEYNTLAIKSREEIAISSDDIMEVLGKEPGSYLKDVYDDLEKMIIYGKLDNNEVSIKKYLENKYKEVL